MFFFSFFFIHFIFSSILFFHPWTHGIIFLHIMHILWHVSMQYSKKIWSCSPIHAHPFMFTHSPNNNPQYRVRHYCQRINVWALRVELEVHAIIPWQWGFTLHNNRSNQCAIIKVIIEMEIFWKETLMKVKFHGIFPALRQIHHNGQIFIFEMPYKYIKNYVWNCYIYGKALLLRNSCVSIEGETQGPCSNYLIVGPYST